MALTTATALKTALAGWLHTDDHDTRLDDYITLFESDFNRRVRVSSMEAAMASTSLVSGEADLPTAFLAFKELRFDGSDSVILQPKPLEWIRAQDLLATGDARYFAISDTKVVCWPPTGPIEGTYYRSLPSLTSNTDNWLLTRHPDCYLAGVLTEGFLFEQDDARASLWRDRAAAVMREIQRADDWDSLEGGTLATRAR